MLKEEWYNYFHCAIVNKHLHSYYSTSNVLPTKEEKKQKMHF